MILPFHAVNIIVGLLFSAVVTARGLAIMTARTKRQESGSFLKKRTKKLLIIRRYACLNADINVPKFLLPLSKRSYFSFAPHTMACTFSSFPRVFAPERESARRAGFGAERVF